jgi:hypothetical protein
MLLNLVLEWFHNLNDKPLWQGCGKRFKDKLSLVNFNFLKLALSVIIQSLRRWELLLAQIFGFLHKFDHVLVVISRLTPWVSFWNSIDFINYELRRIDNWVEGCHLLMRIIPLYSILENLAALFLRELHCNRDVSYYYLNIAFLIIF